MKDSQKKVLEDFQKSPSLQDSHKKFVENSTIGSFEEFLQKNSFLIKIKQKKKLIEVF